MNNENSSLLHTGYYRIAYNNLMCLFGYNNEKWCDPCASITDLLLDFEIGHRAEYLIWYEYQWRGQRIMPVEIKRIKLNEWQNNKIDPSYSLSL